MKANFFLITALCLFFSVNLFSQNGVNVVYLKNGSMIKGTIVEQIPNVSLKLKTYDGSVFVFKAEEIEKITFEEKVQTPSVEQVKPAEVLKPAAPVVTEPEKKIEKPLALTYKYGAVYQGGRKLTPTEIPIALRFSPTALSTFKQAEGYAVVSSLSNVCFWISAGVGILFGIQKKPDEALTLPVIGMGTFFVTQIAFSVAAKNKVKQAIETYNIDLKNSSENRNSNPIYLETAQNGLGLCIRF